MTEVWIPACAGMTYGGIGITPGETRFHGAGGKGN